jgi:hypothetical protein
MLYVKEPTVLSNLPSGFIIQWSLDKTVESIDNYVFTVLTSTDPSIEFEVDGSVSNQLYYTHVVRDFDFSRHYYYQLQVLNTSTGETTTTQTFYLQAAPTGLALKMISTEQRFLSNLVSRSGFFLIRKKTGKTCPRCFDQLKRRDGDPLCSVCYGTGYLGGYYTPIKLYFQFLEPSNISQPGLTNFGPLEANQVTAWISNFPIAAANDALIDTITGIAYLISSVRGTAFGGALIRQILTLQQVEPPAGIYSFPLPIVSTSTSVATATSTLPPRGL